ncbi:MAG TPA: outer membrane beta-barrel protein [Chitinophagaceae bacterium]|nr:outer membrane beta-barrel protein [Chitinophagaceae bacterium]
MKSFFIACIISTVSISAFGQLSKNTWLVGGSGSLYSYNEDYTAPSINVTTKYTNIDLSASVGYFFADKFAGGIRPNFSSSKGESSGGGSMDNIKIAVGPFLRYYFLAPEKQFNILTDVGYQFGINRNGGGNKDKGKFNIFSIMGGTEVFFNSSIGLEILLGYSQRLITVENSPGALRSNKKGFQTSIGFQIHLEK